MDSQQKNRRSKNVGGGQKTNLAIRKNQAKSVGGVHGKMLTQERKKHQVNTKNSGKRPGKETTLDVRGRGRKKPKENNESDKQTTGTHQDKVGAEGEGEQQ